jgi:glycosyltransferase involved in cell wall biosynthesis
MPEAEGPPFSKLTFIRNLGTLRKDFGTGDIAHVHNIGAFSTTLFKALKDQGGHRGTVWMVHDVQLMNLRVPETSFDDVMRGNEQDLARIRAETGEGDHKCKQVWKNLGSNVDRYIATSRFMYNLFQAAGIDKDDCRLVYNGIELEENPVSEVPEEPVILFVAGVVAIKGVDHLIEAMPRVLEEVPDAKLRIVGTGDLELPLQERVRRLGIEDSVAFEGHVDDVRPYFRASQVFVLPSVVYEICSISILEGMAAGRPIVASNRGGNPEQVEDGRTGLLFRAGDHEDMAEKLVSILASRDRAVSFGSAARARTESVFSMDHAVEGTVKIYRELLED